MDEENTNNESTEDTGEGDQPSKTPILDKADATVERMEAATKAQREENDRTEALLARQRLGGGSEAGKEVVEKKEETPKEYHERVKKQMAEGTFDDRK